MAIIPQTRLFCWNDVENLGELKRFQLVLEAIPDEGLMRFLEAQRGHGRDEYPVRAVWNSVLAGVVYQHPSVEALRRELLRNAQLRWMCGFDPVKEAAVAVPNSHNYSRFLGKLMEHQDQIDAMFAGLVDALSDELDGFGQYLALDSKGIRSHGRKLSPERQRALQPDGRRDLDAKVGKKTYRGVGEDGTPWKRVKSWFGYKLHLIVDAHYELPVAYEVTPANEADNLTGLRMLEDLEDAHGELLERCEAAMGDKAYDDVKMLDKLWERESPILPVIPKREDWHDGEATRPLLEGADNIVYDCQGNLYCHCWRTGKVRRMVYWGYEKEREGQKWRCPARCHGLDCESYGRCSGGREFGRVVRVKRERDRRTFLPLWREGVKFERLYARRTAVERVNSRLDVSYGMEQHFIRGGAKMRLRCSLALVVMLAMALGRVRQSMREGRGSGTRNRASPTMRSLVGAA